jgi:hypothetical protein
MTAKELACIHCSQQEIRKAPHILSKRCAFVALDCLEPNGIQQNCIQMICWHYLLLVPCFCYFTETLLTFVGKLPWTGETEAAEHEDLYGPRCNGILHQCAMPLSLKESKGFNRSNLT